MYIKVKVGDQDARTYELSSSEILIGSGSVAHLVIIDPGLSKKHLKLFLDEEVWFAVDQGSTNGTYLNDEKLIPGKALEFDFDIELKLGHQVYIRLLKEADEALTLDSTHAALREHLASKVTDQDKTQIISLDDFKVAKALVEKQKKRELQRKRAAQLRKKKEDQNKIAKSVIIGLFIVAFGVFANRSWKAKQSKIKKDTIVNKIKTKMKGDQEIDTDLLGYRISRQSLISRNRINTLKDSMSCKDQEFLSLCTKGGPFLGVHRDGDDLLIYADEKSWKTKVNVLTNDFENDDSSFKKILFLLVLKRELSQITTTDKRNLYVAFYKEGDNQMKYLSFVGGVDSKIAPMINEKFREEKLEGEVEAVQTMIGELDQYYTIY